MKFAPGSVWLMRGGLGGACLALVFGFALLHAVAPQLYVMISRLPDGVAKPHAFADLRATLQGMACWRRGVNVYAPSACMGGGVFNYAPLLLRAPAGPGETLAGGLVFCLAYAAALAALPAPGGWGAFRLYAAAALSPAAYYALEQGNLDTLIFALAVLALRLAWPLRLLRYALFAGLAAVKFYPVALFLLALAEGRLALAGLLLAGLTAGLVVLALDFHGVAAALAIIPSGTPFRASFGRIDLPRGLAWLHMLPPGGALAWSWLLALAALGLAWLRRRAWQSALASLPADAAAFALAGAAVILFCFMAAQNIEYRTIFLVLLMPGLIRLAPRGPGFRALPWVTVALLWEAVPRAALSGLTQPHLPHGAALGFWLLRAALWWWLIVELLGMALAFLTNEAARLCYEMATPMIGPCKQNDR